LQIIASRRKPVKKIRSGTGIITYRLEGEVKACVVECAVPGDTKETLQEHLRHWIPEAEFVDVEIMPDNGDLSRVFPRRSAPWRLTRIVIYLNSFVP
jgi:hypothetical protein